MQITLLQKFAGHLTEMSQDQQVAARASGWKEASHFDQTPGHS